MFLTLQNLLHLSRSNNVKKITSWFSMCWDASIASSDTCCSETSCHKQAMPVILNSCLLNLYITCYNNDSFHTSKGDFLYSSAHIFKYTYTYRFSEYLCTFYSVCFSPWMAESSMMDYSCCTNTKSFNDSLTEGICLRKKKKIVCELAFWALLLQINQLKCSLLFFLNNILLKFLCTTTVSSWLNAVPDAWNWAAVEEQVTQKSALYITTNLLNVISPS